MRIAKIEDLHCDAGWRTWSFLKITTDDGVVGWSEYNESYGSRGLTAVIKKLAERLIGRDPRPIERLTSLMHAITRQAPGGLAQQAIAAIENALVDVKARALGIPVAELLNGPVRERLRLYWSHCGSYRLDHFATMGTSPVRSLDDIRALGQEVRERGFTALKTNIFCFDQGAPYMYQPGFARNDGWPELNVDQRLLGIIEAQMAAFREGAGPKVDLLLDLNFNFKTEGYLQVAKAIAPYRLLWLEIDSYDPESARSDSPSGRHADRVLRIAVRPAPVPALLRGPGGRCRDRGRALERHPRGHEDRGHGGGLRGQLRAAQLLRPPVDHDERAVLRRDPELPDHGDRHRRRALEGRGGEPAHDRGRASGPDRRAGLGRRGQRGRDPSPSAKELNAGARTWEEDDVHALRGRRNDEEKDRGVER